MGDRVIYMLILFRPVSSVGEAALKGTYRRRI